MHGMYDIRYTPEGLENKESVKMHTLMEEDYTDKIGLIYSNIATFRGFCNGEREEMDINLLSEWL
jgi:predicted NodU family carbamoyl transferase